MSFEVGKARKGVINRSVANDIAKTQAVLARTGSAVEGETRLLMASY